MNIVWTKFLKRTSFRVACCAIIGLSTALGTALVCHAIRLRPTEWDRYAFIPDQIACYAGSDSWLATLPTEFPVGSVLSNDCGVGFRQITLLLPKNLQASPPTYTTHHLLTTLGWPQPIFSTGSNWLGNCGEFRLPVNGGLVTHVIHTDPFLEAPPSATTLHWSGIIFDTITFGLPVLALMMAFPIVGRFGILSRRAIVIVTASWWLAIAYPAMGVFNLFHNVQGQTFHAKSDSTAIRTIPLQIGQGIISHTSEIWFPVVTDTKRESADSIRFEKVLTLSEEWIPIEGESWEITPRQCSPSLWDFAVSWREYNYRVPHPIFWLREGEEVLAGWPMQAFSKGDGTYRIFLSDLSHLDVQWFPWLANVTVLSSGLAIICYPVMRIIRRWRRVAPGQCTTCRYSLNGSAICPECGHACPSKR